MEVMGVAHIVSQYHCLSNICSGVSVLTEGMSSVNHRRMISYLAGDGDWCDHDEHLELDTIWSKIFHGCPLRTVRLVCG